MNSISTALVPGALRFAALIAGSTLFLPACGGEAPNGASGQSAPVEETNTGAIRTSTATETAGTDPSTTATEAAGTDPLTPLPAATADAGAAPNGGACRLSRDTAEIAMVPLSATDGGGEPGANVDTTIEGTITDVAASSFVLCSDAPADAGSCSRVTVRAPDLDLTVAISIGALAKVHFAHVCTRIGCSSDVVVTSLNELHGTPNPSPAASGLYLAADDGAGLMPDLPLAVEHVRLPCQTDLTGGCGGDVPGLFALQFKAGASSALVQMGDTALMSLGNGSVRVRNLRSFIEGYCNNNVNWANWVLDAP